MLQLPPPQAQLLEFFREHDVLKLKMEDLVLSWGRARQELADRIQLTLNEALEANQRRIEEKASVDKQKALCKLLADKVSP